MKTAISILVVSVLLSICACTTNPFFNNGPYDAKVITQSVSIKLINTSNREFWVYKINDAQYALLPKTFANNLIIDDINRAIIFDAEQMTKLRNTCKEIIEAYNRNSKEIVEIIEYHLLLNKPERISSNSKARPNDFLYPFLRTKEANKVLFRLQYTNQPGLIFHVSKKINYMYRSLVGEIKIDDLIKLLNDIQDNKGDTK